MAQLDLTTCDSEPIHIPGAIQPHGILAAVDPTTHLVTHVSANVEELLGRAPATLLGQNVDVLVGNGKHSGELNRFSVSIPPKRPPNC